LGCEGQLENEIAENGWPTCPATKSILFSSDMTHTYERVLTGMGVDPARLTMSCGHA
jgi:putative transcriptional regulator